MGAGASSQLFRRSDDLSAIPSSEHDSQSRGHANRPVTADSGSGETDGASRKRRQEQDANKIKELTKQNKEVVIGEITLIHLCRRSRRNWRTPSVCIWKDSKRFNFWRKG